MPALAVNVLSNLASSPIVENATIAAATKIAEVRQSFGGNGESLLPSLAVDVLKNFVTNPAVLNATFKVAENMALRHLDENKESVLPGLAANLLSTVLHHPEVLNATLDMATNLAGKKFGPNGRSVLPGLALNAITSLASNPHVINATLDLASKVAEKSKDNGWVYSKSFLDRVNPVWKRDEEDTLAHLDSAYGVSSCSNELNSNVHPSCGHMLGGPGGFSANIPNFKITWTDKGPDCRDNIKNVDDLRPAYDQELRISPNAQKNIFLESHINAALNCGPFSKTTLAPGTSRVEKPRRKFNIAEKVKAGSKVLVWRGLTWWTPTVINSCVFDSFFTYMVLKLKLDPSYSGRNFLIPQNPAEAIIVAISSNYNQVGPNPTDVQTKAYSQYAKVMWIKAFFPEFKNHLSTGQVIDFKGSEYMNVITYLNPSSVMYLSGTCKCKSQAGQRVVVAKKAFFKSIDLAELKHLSRESSVPDKIRLQSDPWYDGAYRTHQKTCQTCSTNVKLDYVFTPGTTWMLYFMFNQQTKITNQPNFNQIPKQFFAVELFEQDKFAIFELGYVSCATTSALNGVFHHLSFQLFNNKWYFYDDLKQGDLTLAVDPTLTIKAKSLTVREVVYFRP